MVLVGNSNEDLGCKPVVLPLECKTKDKLSRVQKKVLKVKVLNYSFYSEKIEVNKDEKNRMYKAESSYIFVKHHLVKLFSNFQYNLPVNSA